MTVDERRGSVRPRRLLLLGATGTIGRVTLHALLERGHEVSAVVRPSTALRLGAAPAGARWLAAELGDPGLPALLAQRGERFDALVSCMASRTGAPRDAWAVDHDAHLHALRAAERCGVGQVVLLSAICVQRPRLAFQHAKLAFEQALAASGLAYSIVRATAFFKSLSGQVERVRQGRPFLVFGDGRLTACKPISERDLATYLADCLDDPRRHNRVLPIGGPGPALTPRGQGLLLAELLGREVRIRSVPPGMLRAAAALLGAAGHIVPPLADKAEFARIGHYYATESMLVFDSEQGRYDEAATPSTGTDTLRDHYTRLLRGQAEHERGAAQAVHFPDSLLSLNADT